ncbi:uncharacterized protein LOC115419975 isoform X2 [Sphaeramia orbicularis]|uniref:uncharacterized protein LOC115419975 isoform X2 n=1 Tax=Sphaeramia orbicularis TaxID=375764 RepID=UPI00117CD620|nr:uncharacterized protein LOC115419975 isoform X2 [Sphaeramia orbicularis]
MAGHLLILILTYLAFEVKGQVLRAPKLLVDPPVITEKATVTLNCQTPSPVSECFYIIGGKPAKQFSCLKKLTGTELLSIVKQSPPTEIKVKCFYLQTSASPHSDSFSITIQPLFPPTLIIDPPVIAETDSVTLNCQTPSSVSVSRCYFYTLSGRILGDSSCVQTLKGAELMVNKHLPAEVKLKCYYTVNHGEADSPSPHSAFTSVTVQSQKPHISVHRDESFVIVCSLPEHVKDDTRCNLYFGESTRPQITANAWGKKTSDKQRICQFFIPVNELLRCLDVVQKKDVSCDYSLSDSSVSPRSDGYSLTDIVNTESNKKPVLTMTPELVTDFTNIPTSDASPLNPTSEQDTAEIMTDPTISLTSAALHPTSEHKPTDQTPLCTSKVSVLNVTQQKQDSSNKETVTWILKWVILVAACGVILGVISLGLAFCCNKGKNDKHIHKRSRAKGNGNLMLTTQLHCGEMGKDPPANNTAYSQITCVPGSEMLNEQKPQNADPDVYHVYATIPEDQTSPAHGLGMFYSTVQAI